VPNASPCGTGCQKAGAAAAASDAAASASDFALLSGYQTLGDVIAVGADAFEAHVSMGQSLPNPHVLEIQFVPALTTLGKGVATVKAKKGWLGRLFSSSTPDKTVIQAPLDEEKMAGAELYRQVDAGKWAPVPGTLTGTVLTATVYHFGFYQVFSPIPNLPFVFGEVYVFPNPTRDGEVPTIHVEVGQADTVTARVYDVAGDLVYNERVDGSHIVVAGKAAYEHAMNPSKFKSGIYHGVVTATKGGKETIRKKFRFSVVK
jgi:hypothetical protein